MEKKLDEKELKDINRGFSLRQTMRTEGWKVVEEYFEDLIHHTWMDPREAENRDEAWYKYVVNWGLAHAAQHIRDHLRSIVERAEYLEKKRKGELPSSRFEKQWNPEEE